MTGQPQDLGAGHWLEFISWSPDRDLNPQYEGIPDVPRWGAIVGHPLQPGDTQCAWRGECAAAVTFAGDVQLLVAPDATVWEVQAWEPLTLFPSLLCHCGDHGFIRSGRWVAAQVP